MLRHLCSTQYRRWISTQTTTDRYMALVNSGEFTSDPQQLKIAGKLDQLQADIHKFANRIKPPAEEPSGSFLNMFWEGPAKPPSTASQTTPKGVYLWGGCGTGKTMLMDLFYDSLDFVEKRARIHFHEFLIDVHHRLHKHSQARKAALKLGTYDGPADIMETVASDLANDANLLCFDEFQVTHISDALIMKRLFEILFRKSVIVVATSNRPPEDLYLHGLNRAVFLPFIPLLKSYCEVIHIASQTDYRLLNEMLNDSLKVFYTNFTEFDQKFQRMSRQSVKSGRQITTGPGRQLSVPRCNAKSQVAFFNFKDLCDQPLGAEDYVSISQLFPTIFLAEVPIFGLDDRNVLRRFITAIDVLYEKKVKLFMHSHVVQDVNRLFQIESGSQMDEGFAADRTISRLIEMQSMDYLTTFAQTMCPNSLLAQYELEAMNDQEIDELWLRYDINADHILDKEEVYTLLKSLYQNTQPGERLSPEVFGHGFSGNG